MNEMPDPEWSAQIQPGAASKLKGTTQPYPDVITFKVGRFGTPVNTKRKRGMTEFELVFKDTGFDGTMKWTKQGEDGKPKTAEYTLTGTKK